MKRYFYREKKNTNRGGHKTGNSGLKNLIVAYKKYSTNYKALY